MLFEMSMYQDTVGAYGYRGILNATTRTCTAGLLKTLTVMSCNPCRFYHTIFADSLLHPHHTVGYEGFVPLDFEGSWSQLP